jgi:hypothetical protein
MQIASFDKVLETLVALDGWLTSLGIPSRRDRWHEAALIVERAKEQREAFAPNSEQPTEYPVTEPPEDQH